MSSDIDIVKLSIRIVHYHCELILKQVVLKLEKKVCSLLVKCYNFFFLLLKSLLVWEGGSEIV